MTIDINKNFVAADSSFQWLANKMDSSFALKVGGESQVVFGFNGIGKSSLAKRIAGGGGSDVRTLDYETNYFKDEEQIIVIAPSILRIEELEKEIESAKQAIAFPQMCKASGFKKSPAPTDPPFMAAYKKSLPKGSFPASAKVSSDEYASFLSRHPLVNSSVFFNLVAELSSASSAEEELKKAYDRKLAGLLMSAKSLAKENKCPVCGASYENIEAVIQKRIDSLAKEKADLAEALEKKQGQCDVRTIEAYLSLYKELSNRPDLLNDYVVCGNEIANHKAISDACNSITEKEEELFRLRSRREDKYKEIKRKQDIFISDVSGRLKIPKESVVFIDQDKRIEIRLGREVKTFSTGERHILLFLYQIYSFLGSDSSVLLLDDPASSLDLVNIYKIAFEIVRTSREPSKNLLVFTHSADLINILNSQCPKAMEIYYLEELDGALFCERVEWKGDSTHPNVCSLANLKDCSPKVASLLLAREDAGADPKLDAICHYGPTEVVYEDDNLLSNHKLAALIDSFQGFVRNGFYQDINTKILYLLALRVWVEKQLYKRIAPTNESLQNKFLGEWTLQSRINLIEKEIGLPFSKEELMSKKVMLNQNAHYYSQVLPFAYAMNVSFDDLRDEIMEIKNLFD